MDCAICLAAPENPMTVPCCLQIFCSDCLQTWTQIRSRCPLCITTLGSSQNAPAHQNQSDLDNGRLMIQSELAAILQKAGYLRRLYASKSELMKHSKTHIKRSNIAYAGEELASIEQFLQIAEIAVNEDDRVTATAMMQKITEMLVEAELILKGDKSIHFQDFGYSSEEEQDYYDYQEEVYEKSEKSRAKNGRVGKKKERVN